MRKYEQINVTPLSSAIGAEIGNVDISKDLSPNVIIEIRSALLDLSLIHI